jgi:hypothetical protein
MKCRRGKVDGCWRSYPEDFQFSGERAATSLIGQEGSLGRGHLTKEEIKYAKVRSAF